MLIPPSSTQNFFQSLSGWIQFGKNAVSVNGYNFLECWWHFLEKLFFFYFYLSFVSHQAFPCLFIYAKIMQKICVIGMLLNANGSLVTEILIIHWLGFGTTKAGHGNVVDQWSDLFFYLRKEWWWGEVFVTCPGIKHAIIFDKKWHFHEKSLHHCRVVVTNPISPIKYKSPFFASPL